MALKVQIHGSLDIDPWISDHCRDTESHSVLLCVSAVRYSSGYDVHFNIVIRQIINTYLSVPDCIYTKIEGICTWLDRDPYFGNVLPDRDKTKRRQRSLIPWQPVSSPALGTKEIEACRRICHQPPVCLIAMAIVIYGNT
jgi:hypothetical protein